MKFERMIFLLSFTLFIKCQLFCDRLITSHETETSLIEEMNHNLSNYQNDLGCIEVFLRKGLFNALTLYLEELQRRDVKFRESLKIAINKIQRKNEELHNKFRFDENEFQIVSPAFMWAQSLKDIYILIKFGHRHDSPGCLEVKNQETKFDSTSMYFTGYCVQGDIPIKFELKINLYDEIVDKHVIVNSGSVGRITFTLPKKSNPKYWKSLYKEGEAFPNNMKMWIEMSEKYENEIQPYKEKEEEELINKKKNKERRKGKRKSKKNKPKKDL